MSGAAPAKVRDPRNGLRTSATLATVFTILGHTVLGFEQAVLHVLVALAAGYASAFLFEGIDARVQGRQPGWAGKRPLQVVDWLLSTHMTSITTAFLVYSVDDFWVLPVVVAMAIGSKYALRVRVDGQYRHFMNPSNFAVAVGLLAFPWLGSIPWGMTVNTHGWMDWAVPGVIVALGFRLNLLFTRRLPLIAGWLGAFLAQGLLRAWLLDRPVLAQLAPITGVGLVLFTFYMITDPQTSPAAPRAQVVFGAAIGLMYGLLLELGVNYFFFYAVTAVCAGRGLLLALEQRRARGGEVV